MIKATNFRKPHRIKRKKSILKNRFFWLGILVFASLVILTYFLVFFPFFHVKEIQISGNEKVLTEDIQRESDSLISKKLWSFSSRSIFLVNSRKIKEELSEKFPHIYRLDLIRKFPNILILKVEERKPVATFCLNSLCFLIDKEGVIFEETGQDLFEKFKIRDIQQKSVPSLGGKVIEENILSSILEIEKMLRENIKINIRELVILSEERLNVRTGGDWEIYFALKEDINWQLEKLSLVLEKEIPSEKRGNLEYIDLRFTRVYFKYR